MGIEKNYFNAFVTIENAINLCSTSIILIRRLSWCTRKPMLGNVRKRKETLGNLWYPQEKYRNKKCIGFQEYLTISLWVVGLKLINNRLQLPIRAKSKIDQKPKVRRLLIN